MARQPVVEVGVLGHHVQEVADQQPGGPLGGRAQVPGMGDELVLVESVPGDRVGRQQCG